jgi:amino acid transporter
MHSPKQIPFWSAVIININVMLGAGLFVNTALLAHKAGALGFAGYTISGLLLFPLILCIAELMRLFPHGGFYGYARAAFSPFAGFVSSWSYFTAKLASAALTLHTAVLLLQQLIPFFNNVSALTLDCIILSLFIGLNMHNVKTGSSIQSFFMGAKLIPLLTAIFGGLWLFKGSNFTTPHLIVTGIPSIIPLVLYATIGFEAAVSLSSSIENPEKNGPRVIITSYSIVIILACLYQAIFYGALGSRLIALTDFRDSFATFFEQLLGINALGQSMTAIIYLAIASSALGGCYGILFSNHWNLYRLAQHNHILGYTFFKQLNKNQIPWLCVLAEGVLCFSYLIITQGTLVLLQQISGLGTVIAYTLSVLSLMQIKTTRTLVKTRWWLMILGLINCGLLIGSCIRGLLKDSSSTFIAFGTLMALGCTMFVLTKFKSDERA